MMTYVAAFLSGLLGSMGFGGGSVLIIYLTLFAGTDQIKAQGVNLLFFIPCAVVSVIINIRNKLVKYRLGAYIVLGGAVGIIVGFFAVRHIDTSLLSRLFGIFIFAIGLVTLFQKPKKRSAK
ncbi:MAG: TSUP family transporter [Acutalibacteraceae bacterium]|nr:sulfite exporter TauE/SafE family protein [Oscillospiraceae bacterium]